MKVNKDDFKKLVESIFIASLPQFEDNLTGAADYAITAATVLIQTLKDKGYE